MEATFPSTPKNQPIGSYEDIGLSPGSMKPLNEVQDKIKEDCILDEKFETVNILVFRLIVFLYGKGYGWGLERNERVEMIREIVESAKSRKLLRDVACPVIGHEYLLNDWALELYCRVGLTAKWLFDHKDAKGGFPRGEPILRFQRSANCYAPASCLFVTLQWRIDMPNDPEAQKPLDVSQLARKYALNTDEALRQRVIDNKGMSAVKFASEIIGREPDNTAWGMHDFHLRHPTTVLDRAAVLAKIIEKENKFGLVTNFRVYQGFIDGAKEETKKFQETMKEEGVKPRGILDRLLGRKKKKAAKKKNNNSIALGYRKFEGFDPYTKGESVNILYDKKLDKKQKELREIWEQQAADVKEKLDKHSDEVLAVNVPKGRWQDPSVEAVQTPKSADPTPGADGSGRHAMVLLGTFSEYKKDALTKKKRKHIYFVLLNSWHSMPLVVVSPEYLMACEALIYCLKGELGQPTEDLERDTRVWGESSFCDGGDDSRACLVSFFSTSIEEGSHAADAGCE